MKSTNVVVAGGCTFAGAILLKRLFSGNDENGEPIPTFLSAGTNEKVLSLLANHIDDISNDSLIKIVRQLEFWITKEKLGEKELLELTERLVRTATWRKREFQVPKVRFGRTELQMPIITCGSMRFQHTWMPDNIPVIGSNTKKAVETPSQENLTEVVRQCLKMGINHFETARYYGTSEAQLMHALATLMENGEIKRSDFILQTKLPPLNDTKKFQELFDQSWAIFEKLEYIDLLSFWCVSKYDQKDWTLGGCMDLVKEWKNQGKIKHVGFSTHGSASVIMDLINSNQFDYVNLHYHFFGSYHAEGSPDGVGGHGNQACVRRALELDMGVFAISPIDKGGRLYQPTAAVARATGPAMTPIAFANLHLWKTAGIHTVSVGFARPEDLDEILEAADLFQQSGSEQLVKDAESRLLQLAKDKVGEEWLEKGMLNIPDWNDPKTEGVALGHILWCHNMITMYGMFETAKGRYKNLVGTAKSWKKKKSFEENIDTMTAANPGCALDPTIALKEVLAKHYNPELVIEKIVECDRWLKDDSKFSAEDQAKYECNEAYDLRPWPEFPDMDRLTPAKVVLQNISGGLFGAGGGPTKESREYGDRLRVELSSHKC